MSLLFPTGEELRRGLAAVVPLFTFDASGLALLAKDRSAALASFKVASLALPAYLFLLPGLVAERNVEPIGPHFLLVWLLAYVLMWTVLPLLLLEFARGKDIAARVPHFISALNWLSLPVIYAKFITAILPFGLREPLEAAVAFYVMALQWFLARKALGLSGWGAVAFVVASLAIDTIIVVTAVDMTVELPQLQN